MSGQFQAGDIAVYAAVNDRVTLSQCLQASPDLQAGVVPFESLEGFPTAGAAFNTALDKSDSRVLVFAHQDVYLPAGTIEKLTQRLNELTMFDPDWAVVGCIGIDADYEVHGWTWSSGRGKLVGRDSDLPQEIQSLDELVLVIRGDIGLRFDEDLPSFHLYGTDIVQVARKDGRRSYVVDLPVVHHSRPLANLGGGFRVAYKYCQRKWEASLPIPTLMGGLHESMLPLNKRDLRYRIRNRGSRRRSAPVGSASDIAARLGLEG